MLLEAFPPDRLTLLKKEPLATREKVREALPTHRWVHFSCHGDQDLKDPSHGELLLYDALLTIADITEGRFHGDFAGLSACKTAVGGVDLLDEAITLAAALHYTGYRHVVAALWSVDTATSSEVFTQLYRRIVHGGWLDPDRAPAALHRVVRAIRRRHPEWPHRASKGRTGASLSRRRQHSPGVRDVTAGLGAASAIAARPGRRRIVRGSLPELVGASPWDSGRGSP